MREIRSAAVLAFLMLAACASAQSPTSTAPTGPETGASGASGAEPAASCDNAYFPVVEGASWSYRVESQGGPGSRYEDTVTSVDEEGFVITTRFPGLEKESRWSCTAGGLVSLSFGGGPSVSLTTLGSETSFDTQDVAGVTIPSAVEPGDTWRQTFRIHGEGFISDEITATTDGTVRIAFEAIGVEDVSVPAGSFSTLRIDMHVRLAFEIDMGSGSVPFNSTVEGSSWFAEDFGMVMATSEGDIADTLVSSETVLTSVKGL